MELQKVTNETNCLRAEIGAYIDGELSPAEELALEAHVAVCKNCLSELNLQKQMLSALDFSLDEKAEIVELPRNFAKTIAVRAESGVCGLRSKDERFRAVFLCAVLFLITLIGLVADTENLPATFAKFGEQVLAVISFVGHLIYDLAIGAIVILRSLGGQFIFNSAVSIAVAACVFTLSAAALSRLISRNKRA